MQYLLAIYSDEAANAERFQDDAARGAMMKGYFDFNDATKAASAYVAGDALQPTATARSVRVRDGEVIATDGPFAETKEQLGGYYLLECDSMDDALAWAAKIPHAKWGTIEVRPIMVIPGDG